MEFWGLAHGTHSCGHDKSTTVVGWIKDNPLNNMILLLTLLKISCINWNCIKTGMASYSYKDTESTSESSVFRLLLLLLLYYFHIVSVCRLSICVLSPPAHFCWSDLFSVCPPKCSHTHRKHRKLLTSWHWDLDTATVNGKAKYTQECIETLRNRNILNIFRILKQSQNM